MTLRTHSTAYTATQNCMNHSAAVSEIKHLTNERQTGTIHTRAAIEENMTLKTH